MRPVVCTLFVLAEALGAYVACVARHDGHGRLATVALTAAAATWWISVALAVVLAVWPRARRWAARLPRRCWLVVERRAERLGVDVRVPRCVAAEESRRVGLRQSWESPAEGCRRAVHARGTLAVAGPDTRETSEAAGGGRV